MKILTYISILFILVTAKAAAQDEYVPFDIVCKGSERTYRVNGEKESEWKWLLHDSNAGNKSSTSLSQANNFVAKDADGNEIQGSEVTIVWDYEPGIYYLEVLQTNMFGCDSMVTGYIEVIEGPVADAGTGTFICRGDVIDLEAATANNHSSVSWIGGDGSFDDPDKLNPVYTPGPKDLAAGYVELTLIAYGKGYSGGCDQAVSTVMYTINDLRAQITTSTNKIEAGQSIRLNGNQKSSGTIVNHLWAGDAQQLTYLDNPAAVNPIFNPDGNAPAGKYTFTYTVTDEAGCTSFDVITIEVTKPDAGTENNPPQAGNREYTTQCFPLADYLTDLVFDPDNDAISFSINPVVDIPDSKGQVIIYEDGLFQYYSDGYEGMVQFEYEVCDNGSPSLCDTGIITIHVLPEADCDKLPGDDQDNDPDYVFFIPEGFSPNGDQVHDCFVITGIEKYPNATLRIFDRAGNKLYQKHNYGNENVWSDKRWWDGSSENKRTLGRGTLPAGNYLYILELGNGKIKTGTVMIAY